ncbi:MAG: outer membrane protein assembly factor BamB [Legionellaceae bacterium]|nr:outer membrane protein assembly factor BamB [Legionellaceae bacterium]|tara:strand:- start:695 stop:1837 length:1143 start_codon:yes stop_codon:yes gene_type:complete
MKKLLAAALILPVLWLAGCSTQDPALRPSPLPIFSPSMSVKSVWSKSIGDGASGYYLHLQPALSNGNLYVASYDGVLMAIRAQTGQVLWETRSASHYVSGVSIDAGKLFVATNSGKLMAVNQNDGAVLWTSSLNSQSLARPEAYNGMVLVHTIDGAVTAFRESDGGQLWQYKQTVPGLILHLASQPQLAGQYAVCGFANGTVATLHASDGKLMWSRQVAEPQGATVIERMVDIDVSPIVANGVVYVGSYQGKLVALNIIDGKTLWQRNVSVYAGLAADHHYLFLSDAGGNVSAYDQSNGSVFWTQKGLARRGLTAPTIAGPNSLVVGDKEGYVHWMSLKDGHFLAQARAALDPIIGAPVAEGHYVFVYSQSGRLIAYRTS